MSQCIQKIRPFDAPTVAISRLICPRLSRLAASSRLSGREFAAETYPDRMLPPKVMQVAPDGNRHRLTALQLGLHRLLLLVDPDLERAAVPLHREGQLPPGGRQLWIKRDTVAPRRQAREAQDRHHPIAAERRDVDASANSDNAIGKIDGRALPQVLKRLLRIADSRRRNAVHRRA